MKLVFCHSISANCWWHILYFLAQIAFLTTYHSSNRLGKIVLCYDNCSKTTVRKNYSSDRENFWRPRIFKFLEITKGQVTSKANCQDVNSSKKLLCDVVSLIFLEEIEVTKNTFRIYLTFSLLRIFGHFVSRPKGK